MLELKHHKVKDVRPDETLKMLGGFFCIGLIFSQSQSLLLVRDLLVEGALVRKFKVFR